ncbi:helix-turn-helix domain-containing protein [Streptomyces sp. CA-210063]|uniref:helix-turn-helix domain-containing protein n=1 Tax=Streptomyces sp. CA-210063 TaxID=2801029 RepID=UPI00214B307F|nr:helix-turn-helix domain-containing protein [Streptomyces sp. CA-210063]UUU31941.1 helix-turn-helix domain-containing protein [Streptomyces sp. CA-210063]
MSVHLLFAAADLSPRQVTPLQKLALMKIADSADDQTRISTPTLQRIASWAGVSENQADEIVWELAESGLLAVDRHEDEVSYRVFPDGVPSLRHR